MRQVDWSALLLPAVVAVATAPARAADYLSVAQAQQAIFPQASFSEQPLKLGEAQRDRIKAVSGLRQRWDEQKVWRVERNGQPAGWFIVDDVVGKHEFITYAVGITPAGQVAGIEILSYRETHGGQVRDAAWRSRFKGKTAADPFKLDEDIPNITGATLSCRNLTDGVKRLLVLHQLFLAKA